MSSKQHRWSIDVVSRAGFTLARSHAAARADHSRDSSGVRGVRESQAVLGGDPTAAMGPRASAETR